MPRTTRLNHKKIFKNMMCWCSSLKRASKRAFHFQFAWVSNQASNSKSYDVLHG